MMKHILAAKYGDKFKMVGYINKLEQYMTDPHYTDITGKYHPAEYRLKETQYFRPYETPKIIELSNVKHFLIFDSTNKHAKHYRGSIEKVDSSLETALTFEEASGTIDIDGYDNIIFYED